MGNLRIISVTVVDSTTIKASFTENLSRNIKISNISILSQLDSVPSPEVLKIEILENILTITAQPLTPQAAYFIVFSSTTDSLFKSLNGNSVLYEDGVTNKQLILGPAETDNPIQEFLVNYLRKNIYNVTDTSTLVNKIVQGQSTLLSKSLYDIRQIKNENYISFNINDEQKTRGSGPFDRLNEEGAYEIVRVGRTATGAAASITFGFDEFPVYPVTLLTTSFSENLTITSDNKVGNFNINDFILNVSKRPVTKLTKVTFIYNDGRSAYSYPIETLGYQILNSRYDQDFGFTYLTLLDNQFKLSETILKDDNFSTRNISQVQTEYEYKNLGRIINDNSVKVSTVLSSIREVLPPVINVFNLKHAPITDSSGNIPKSGGITFTDPNALNSSRPHPAFVTELQFRFSAPPSKPGEYSIDYNTGTVYVFGSDTTNSGTGPLPPLATYLYNYIYKPDLDYVYDVDLHDLVALPNGSLIENAGTINFNYEEVLVPGIDYNANVHVEELSERIENRLVAINSFRVKNAPITNVFRIFNETSGEIYNAIRWSNDKIYFSYNTPPNVAQSLNERVSFTDVLNEILFVNSRLTNNLSINVFKCLLHNSNIVSATEDAIASFINSSVKFSDNLVFKKEKWFNISETESNNINRLNEVGQYQIDYANGIVYVAISDSQLLDIGTISYKNNSIKPINSHLISVDDIYYRISILNPKNKQFSYSSFGEGFIYPENLDSSDEGFLNGDLLLAYQIHSGKIGVFNNAIFVPGVTNSIKFLRGIYCFDDLRNNTLPLNFAESSTFSDTIISVGDISKQEYNIVLYDGYDYYINLDIDLPYVSSNISFDISVTRNSDSLELWDGDGQIVAGEPLKLILSGINSPAAGDTVVINYSISINDLSRVIIDYNKGEYYIDYSYLADEIIVSYEYGENFIDFRQSNSITKNETYFVTYKVGALRDGLLKNFGTLINIPELSALDVDLERERYRDAISAALESFIQGPTVTAIQHIAEKISHIKPEIIESIFQSWSLGTSLLTPRSIETTGEFQLLPAKYGNGVLVKDSSDQNITLPASSNLKLENGTFESWIIPEWNGIDNDVELKINILKNGVPLPSNNIFIGAGEYHPDYDGGNNFTVTKGHSSGGLPNTNKAGVFIYYYDDPSLLFKRWFLKVIDGYSDGYFDGYDGYSDGYDGYDGYNTYLIKVTTPGLFYDVKSLVLPKPSHLSITSGLGKLTFKINNSNSINDGLTFIADREHYLLDFGETHNKNRFSIYKDPSGYLNFRVYDHLRTAYSVSADVSNWKAHEKHHVATSWTLDSKNNRDELHLFIDGFEVPNIIRYGTTVRPFLHEKFRTINPEEIAGVVTKNIVSSIDLITTTGSNQIISSLNFNDYGIGIGDIINIDEPGFITSGYTITAVNGNILSLNSSMPASLTDGRFTINRISIPVNTELGIYPNIAVSTISYILSGTDLNTTINSEIVSSSTINFTSTGIIPGYLLRVENTNFVNHYVVLNVSGSSLTLDEAMPETTTDSTFYIYPNEDTEISGLRALRPSYSISQSTDGYYNNILTLNNNVSEHDLIFIKTLGLNHKRIKQKYYQWGNSSNIIQTLLPPPVSLEATKIYHILFPTALINSSNSTIDGYGIFTSDSLITEQPSSSDHGRTLEVSISTTDNIDFSVPVTITISGNITEAITFDSVGRKNTVNKFSSVSGVVVSGKPINVNKTFITLSVREALPITIAEDSENVPVIRYSYQTRAGSSLTGDGSNALTDLNGFFGSTDVGNYLIINSPAPVAGTYQITGISSNNKSITISSTLPSFTSGVYQILNASTFRSGFQNGFFLLEQDGYPGQPYNLKQGSYEFDFYTYLSIKLDPIDKNIHIGTDLEGAAGADSIIDELMISSAKISDTRIGEAIPNNQQSITKDFNSLKALKANSSTLVLSHFDSFPFTNDAPFYIVPKKKNIIQSGYSINDNFSQSIYLTDKPYIIDNNGILTSKTEGTIEFWVNPIFDTANDPNFRFYFDAAGTIIENAISLNDVTVQTSGRIGRVLSVKALNGDPNIDYFAGGRVEVDTQDAISEISISLNTNTVVLSKKILQVISVKIINDPTGMDYFQNGIIGTDKKTIYLSRELPEDNLSVKILYKTTEGNNNQILNQQIIRLNKKLPTQQTPVVVTYVPSGLTGDRISIYKDPSGFINFNIGANGVEHLIRAPILWSQNTWHRLKATFKVNGGKGTDEIRLFVDGYEYGNILFGTGLLFGVPQVFGLANAGSGGIVTNIKFNDILNEIYIGTDFTGKNGAYALINNLKISNQSRPIFSPFGESIDVNYNSNINVAFPVTEDLYTTFLLDFNSTLVKNEDFATLYNKNSGIFNFSVNVFDSLDIINNNIKVKEILEVLIKTLKPANSRVFIKYS